jgi:hypothetical protein
MNISQCVIVLRVDGHLGCFLSLAILSKTGYEHLWAIVSVDIDFNFSWVNT